MPNYYFQARNSEGQKITGKRAAQSTEALSTQLSKEGMIPIDISILAEPNEDPANLLKKYNVSRVTYSELNIFIRQMQTLYKAGIPMTVALARIAEATNHYTLRTTLYRMIENIESGNNLSAALSRYPNIFPQLMINLVSVGEISGRLSDIFILLGRYFESEEIITKRLKSVMRYPMIVLSTVSAALIILNIFVLPIFAKMFAASHLTLPLPTKIILGFSTFVRNHWLLILIIIIAIVIAFMFYIKSEEGHYKWDKFKITMPILGKVLHQILLSRFTQTFSIVNRAGVPIVEGVQLVATALENNYATKQVLLMRQAIERGDNITLAARRTELFSPLILQLMAVGEETGAMDSMLDEATAFYEREIDYDLKRLNDLLEPLILIIMASFVLILALAVYLPMWDMARMARG